MAGSEGCASEPVVSAPLARGSCRRLGVDLRCDELLLGDCGDDRRKHNRRDYTLRRGPGMIALLVVTGQLKVLAGVFALALVSPWGRRLMRTLAWIGGGGLLLYSIALLVQHGLMAVGVIERAASLSASELRWHLWFWDPFWLLGGILFTVAARACDASDKGR